MENYLKGFFDKWRCKIIQVCIKIVFHGLKFKPSPLKISSQTYGMSLLKTFAANISKGVSCNHVKMTGGEIIIWTRGITKRYSKEWSFAYTQYRVILADKPEIGGKDSFFSRNLNYSVNYYMIWNEFLECVCVQLANSTIPDQSTGVQVDQNLYTDHNWSIALRLCFLYQVFQLYDKSFPPADTFWRIYS